MHYIWGWPPPWKHPLAHHDAFPTQNFTSSLPPTCQAKSKDSCQVLRPEKPRWQGGGEPWNSAYSNAPHYTHETAQSHTADAWHGHRHRPASVVPIPTFQLRPRWSTACQRPDELLSPVGLFSSYKNWENTVFHASLRIAGNIRRGEGNINCRTPFVWKGSLSYF